MVITMSIIDEIKVSRKSLLSEEQKTNILECVKAQLVNNECAYIRGAEHFAAHGGHKWVLPKTDAEKGRKWSLEAPYPLHHAITEWLKSLGFSCCRYYNNFGVDQGIRISI